MQTVTDQFKNYVRADIRPLSWHLLISFTKQTIDKSWPVGTQEWDKYVYTEFSERLISVEWSREADFPSSVTMAMCDLVLDNHDDYFTNNVDSPIDNYLLAGRPIKLFVGFGGILIPAFVGLTDTKPVIDDRNKTASFHCVDFLSSLAGKSLVELEIFQNNRIDEILLGLFESAGLGATQLDLDEALTIVEYTWFEKDSKLLEGVKTLMVPEQGRLFMTEDGVITFRNRQNYSNDVVWTFDPYGKNILPNSSAFNDVQNREENQVINVVEITGHRREEQPNQPYGTRDVKTIPANGTAEIFIDFPEPVTSVDDPVYVDDATTSSFEVNTAEDGSGSADSTHVTLTTNEVFQKSCKLTFTNTLASDLYVRNVVVYAKPVLPIGEIYAREIDQNSIDENEEHTLTIENNLYQNSTDASAKAQLIINDYAEADIPQVLDVKGNPALQIDDVIELNNYGKISTLRITKIVNKIMDGKFTQLLTVKEFVPATYFQIGVSMIGGTDQIYP